jgi:WhiB family redox-sensing transcriptional regulator
MAMRSNGTRSTNGATQGLPANTTTAALAVADFLRIVGSSPAETAKRWQERANCLGVDPDLFFPERGASTREAKGVCRGCEVRVECLEYALQHGEKFGIWGGLSERERRRVRRQRALERRRVASA